MNIENHLQTFLQQAKKPLIVILGPTGAGKTSLSLQLAKEYNGEIVNADSRQIYKEMNIGTAKITTEETDNIPHHLLSFKNPDEIFTVAEYKPVAIKTIDSILNRSHIPLLVGGTGLYINAVCFNYTIPTVTPDWDLRKELEEKDKKQGGTYLYKKLQELDPESAKKIHPNQKRHLIRAVEIAMFQKQQLDSGQAVMTREKKKETPLFDCFFIGLQLEREKLYERINQRVEQMFTEGLEEEVRGLLQQGYTKETHAMSGIGYKEVIPYIEGKISLEESKVLLKQHTRNYAKRQVTWFRKMKDIHWIEK